MPNAAERISRLSPAFCRTRRPGACTEPFFGEGGLGATDFKMSPGTNREATAQEMAAEIGASLRRVMPRIKYPYHDRGGARNQ